MDDQLAAIVAEGTPTDLPDWDTDRLRARRTADEALEAAVSYARRVLQGRLDILRAELEGRDGDGDASDLLSRLPQLLAGDHHATEPARARATGVAVPETADALVARIDADAGLSATGELADRTAAQLADAVDALASHEADLSQARRVLFARIDAIRDELATRYRDGRADVADLLR